MSTALHRPLREVFSAYEDCLAVFPESMIKN